MHGQCQRNGQQDVSKNGSAIAMDGSSSNEWHCYRNGRLWQLRRLWRWRAQLDGRQGQHGWWRNGPCLLIVGTLSTNIDLPWLLDGVWLEPHTISMVVAASYCLSALCWSIYGVRCKPGPYKGSGGNKKLPPRRYCTVGIVRVIRQTTTQPPPQTLPPCWCSVCLPYGVDSMNRPNPMRWRPSAEVDRS